MSCEDQWRQEVGLLQDVTRIAPGSADAAPRCKQPDCRRPLKKDGTCPRGCPQDSTAPERPAVPPELAAARCMLAALEQHRPAFEARQYLADAVAKARTLLDLPTDCWAQMSPETSDDNVLQLVKLLDDVLFRAYAYNESEFRHRDWDYDPRWRAVRTAAVDILLARAEAHLTAQPPDMAAAWRDLAAAHDRGEHRERQPLLQALRQRILPLGQHESATVLGNYLHQHTGFAFNVSPQDDQGFLIFPSSSTCRRGHPYEQDFSPAARQSLLVLGLGPLIPPGVRGGSEAVALSLEQASMLVHGHVQQAQSARQELDTAWKAFEQSVTESRRLHPTPPSAETLARWATAYALPLWQQCRHAITLKPTFAKLAERDNTVYYTTTRMQKGLEAAARLLREVPPHLLPRALAPLHLPPRVLNLLKFQAVRDTVFQDAGPDLLQSLPTVAPKAILGLRVCEQIEALETKRQAGAALTWADVATLTQASRDLDYVLEASDTLAPDDHLCAARALVEALSVHVPSDRAPVRLARSLTGEPRYAGDTRLQQAQNKAQDLWKALRADVEHAPLDLLRGQAEQAGMPHARYANRAMVTAWFAAVGHPQEREVLLDNVRRELQGSRSTLPAVDRTGADRTFKVGGRVHLEVDGTPQEGTISFCLLDATRDPYSGLITDLTPAAQVDLADGTTVTVPIAQLELVRRRKAPKKS